MLGYLLRSIETKLDCGPGKVNMLQQGGFDFGHAIREKYFAFDPEYTPLNHGSYGAFPTTIRGYQRALQDKIEARSDPFIRFAVPDLVVGVPPVYHLTTIELNPKSHC